jgi:hypothetical protein
MYGSESSECKFDVISQPHEGRFGKPRIAKMLTEKNRTSAYAGLRVD